MFNFHNFLKPFCKRQGKYKIKTLFNFNSGSNEGSKLRLAEEQLLLEKIHRKWDIKLALKSTMKYRYVD